MADDQLYMAQSGVDTIIDIAITHIIITTSVSFSTVMESAL